MTIEARRVKFGTEIDHSYTLHIYAVSLYTKVKRVSSVSTIFVYWVEIY